MFKYPACRLTALAATMFLLFTPSGHAASILWTLTDIVFDDGGTATGSFIYDADTNMFSSVSVTTSGGSIDPGNYSDVLFGDATNAGLVGQLLADYTGDRLLQLIFQTPLTNAGGIVDLTFINPAFSSFEFTCGDSGCFAGTIERTMVTGGLIGTPVPATAPLMVSGIGVWLAWMRRERKSMRR